RTESVYERLEIAYGNAGYRDEPQAGIVPLQHVVALACLRRTRGRRAPRPLEQIEHVQVTLVHQGGNPLAVEHVESAANQFETLRSEVHALRRATPASVEPGHSPVLVSGAHVDQVTGQHPAHVIGD